MTPSPKRVPSAAGILLEHFGFPWATMFIVCFGLFFLVAGSSIQCYKYKASLCTGHRPGFLRKVVRLGGMIICIIAQNIVFQKNQGYEEIGERGATDSESLLGDRGGEDQHSLARRQRRSPSMGYDSAGSNSPDSQSRKNSNEQVCPIFYI